VRQLSEENCALSQKYQDIQRAKWAEDLVNMKKLESLQELLDDRNRQIRELWNVIQRLDEDSMMFKNEADDSEEMKKQLNNESCDLEVYTSDDDWKNNILISCNTADWRQKLHQELSVRESRNQRDCEEKFNGSLRLWGQSDVKKVFKHMQEEVVCTTKLQKTYQQDAPNLKVKRSRSVNFVKDNEMDEMTGIEMNKEKVQRFNGEPLRNGCRSTDALAVSPGSAIWGFGLWPLEWTAVPNVFKEEILQLGNLKNICEQRLSFSSRNLLKCLGAITALHSSGTTLLIFHVFFLIIIWKIVLFL